MPRAGVDAGARESVEAPVWQGLAIEEYRALRDEIVATMEAQHRALTFGALAFGIVPTIAAKGSAGIASVLLIFLTPLLGMLVLMIWGGETLRMLRAGTHLAKLEQAVRHEYWIRGVLVPHDVFSWECNLRYQWVAKDRRALRGPEHLIYRGFIPFLFLVCAGSIAGGAVIGVRGHSGLMQGLTIGAASLTFLLISLVLLCSSLFLTRTLDRSEYPQRLMPLEPIDGGPTDVRETDVHRADVRKTDVRDTDLFDILKAQVRRLAHRVRH